ncbi:hypothetical protein H6F43_17615 [Leptolyngbya sp. FACHB-36]|uniref:hypothetical protein n=1 Tax=Leptolyngbya sp. FACHB-36 TaxID=2692808 RepID=UPI0016816F44|nr:hypothetical protein [Leptolyngbya sp. FACHB-36]MBD2022000.1 hypothetical protein [Leptolyngbya sp. FACHB-36]
MAKDSKKKAAKKSAKGPGNSLKANLSGLRLRGEDVNRLGAAIAGAVAAELAQVVIDRAVRSKHHDDSDGTVQAAGTALDGAVPSVQQIVNTVKSTIADAEPADVIAVAKGMAQEATQSIAGTAGTAIETVKTKVKSGKKDAKSPGKRKKASKKKSK